MIYLKRWFVLLTVFFVFSTSYAEPALDDPTAKAEIHQALQTWAKAVESRSPAQVLRLYAPDAVLLPTFSDTLSNTPTLRKEYFDHFLQKKDLKVKINLESIRVFDNIAISSGFYDFSYLENKKKVKVVARFSFVYKKTTEGWLILEHHSSQMP